MRKMSDPPEEFEDAYEALRELFDAYTEFTNLVINPSGNLQTFTSNFNDADSALLNCYNAMSLYRCLIVKKAPHGRFFIF